MYSLALVSEMRGAFSIAVGELVDLGVELRRRHHVADDAVGQRALGAHLEHRIDQIGHRLSRHAVDERRHHHGRHDLVRHLRHREARLVAGERDVAGRGDRAAEAVRAALHHGDDRDRAIAHRAIGVEHHVGEAPPRVGGRLDRGPRAHAGAADAEVLAGAAQHHDVGFLRAPLDELRQLAHHVVGDGVAALGLVQRDAQDRPVLLHQNFVCHVVLRSPLTRPCRFALARISRPYRAPDLLRRHRHLDMRHAVIR